MSYEEKLQPAICELNSFPVFFLSNKENRIFFVKQIKIWCSAHLMLFWKHGGFPRQISQYKLISYYFSQMHILNTMFGTRNVWELHQFSRWYAVFTLNLLLLSFFLFIRNRKRLPPLMSSRNISIPHSFHLETYTRAHLGGWASPTVQMPVI